MIAKAVEDRGWTKGAELGVLHGRTLLYLLARCQNLHMLAVDTWEPKLHASSAKLPEGFRSYEHDDLEAGFDYVQRQVGHHGWTGRCEIMRMETARAADFVMPGSLDFVFIDADHTYEGVRDDILRWAPKLRDGGALMGHDANNPSFPGVTRALDELLPGWQAGPDHTWTIGYEKIEFSS